MKRIRNTVCLILIALTLLTGTSMAETTNIPKIYINKVPVVFLNQENTVVSPVMIEGEVYVPLSSLLNLLQMSYVITEDSIAISTGAMTVDSAQPATSGIKLGDFQAMIRKDTTFEKCEFARIESAEGTGYAYPVDKDYGFTVYTDEQEMITNVIYETTFDHENNVPYLNSLTDYEFFSAMANMSNVPMRDFPVFTFVNNSATVLMYITGNSEDNPYSKVFECNGEAYVENNWEYTLITNEEEQTARIEFNYIGE